MYDGEVDSLMGLSTVLEHQPYLLFFDLVDDSVSSDEDSDQRSSADEDERSGGENDAISSAENDERSSSDSEEEDDRVVSHDPELEQDLGAQQEVVALEEVLIY